MIPTRKSMVDFTWLRCSFSGIKIKIINTKVYDTYCVGRPSRSRTIYMVMYDMCLVFGFR